MKEVYDKHINEKRERAREMHIYSDCFVPDAVYSDGTDDYRCPSEPGINSCVTIRLRTGIGGVRRVILVVNGEEYETVRVSEFAEGLFALYEAKLQLTDEAVDYFFRIDTSEGEYFYNRLGADRTFKCEGNFRITPGFSTPDWAKGAVFYQIYVDRFCNGDTTNDVLDGEYCYIGEPVKHVINWDRYPSTMDVRDFYGGDLAGVLQKLDYIKSLGVSVIYLNPIFTSPSNHKYDTQDYDCIDPHYGVIATRRGETLKDGDKNNAHATSYSDAVTNPDNKRLTEELFITLVEEIHKRGMKIILDGVFNHCGSFNKWLDREMIYEGTEGFPSGAYLRKDSPYTDYFDFKEDKWPENGSYDGWWGHDTLPKLNYEKSRELYDYIMSIARKWVSAPYNCDGWRLDVAADLGHTEEFNHKFWQDFRKNVKEANPDAIILAEHYGDPESWLRGNEWDTIMNYDAFMEPVTWFFTGMEKHSDAKDDSALNNGEKFKYELLHNMNKFQTSSLYVSMNELSNHDHSRFLTRTNRKVGRIATLGPKAAEQDINKAVFREAVIFQMMWPGAPTVYYGDEAGVCGFTDPDNRRTYPWGREDKELIAFHKEMISIHNAYDCIKTGSLKILIARYGVFVFGRFNNKDKIAVAFNNSNEMQEVTVPVWQIGVTVLEVMVRLIYTNDDGYCLDTKLYTNEDGYIRLNMPPHSAIVLKNVPDFI